MTDAEKQSLGQRKIEDLYGRHETPSSQNIIPFVAPMGHEVNGLMTDMYALLENPQTRGVSKEILENALHQIGAHFVGLNT